MTSDEIKLKNVTSTPELLTTVKGLASDITANAAAIKANSTEIAETTEKINTAISEQMTVEDTDSGTKYSYKFYVKDGYLGITLTEITDESEGE